MSTRLAREKEVYDRARVDEHSGELLDFDDVIYPAVIRQRQRDLICQVATLVRPRRVLDVGCGGGWSTHLLSQLSSLAIGLDVSRALVATARGRAWPKADFIIADGNQIPFREKSIDLLVSVAALHHLETGRALREWRRVLAPGGRLLVFEPNRLNPLAAIGRRLFPFETHTPDERPFTPEELKRLLKQFDWELLRWSTDILFTFALSRFARVHELPRDTARRFVPFLVALEAIARKCPLTRELGWILVGLARPVSD